MAQNYGFSIYFVIGCCDPSAGSSERFKNGDLSIKGEKALLAQKFAEMHELLQIVKFILSTCDNKKIIITHKFHKSLWAFIHREDYCHKRLVHAFNAHPKNVRDILVINSETLIYEALGKKLFKYYTKPK